MLTNQEQLRYSRQILLDDIGEQGQLKLANASVLIIGLGGLGSPVALYLAAAGVGRLLLADGDQLDVTNLQRQVLYRADSIGEAKADSAQEQLEALNPEIDVEAIDEALDSESLEELLPEVDLVMDCTDNLATRHLINRGCVAHQVPLISGSAIRFEGQLLAYLPEHQSSANSHDKSACYHCVVPESAKLPAGTCQTSGVIGPLLGVIGSMQALEAIKLLTGMCSGLKNQLKLFDAKTLSWQSMVLSANPDCPVCGNS